ncbi:hypothetical protein B0H13DRAFT_1909764 [Mycena leptocephala]|nr:hypothetical protein B0H13DRAFT_1909764 [Mycena leptocephala]
MFAFPQALLCRHCWGNFVVGTEHDRAAMDVIQKFIGDAFTQSHSIIKKEIVKSVETLRVKGSQTHIPTLRPNTTHTTIYQLTKTIVQKLSGGKVVSIPITPALCGCIALMLVDKTYVKSVSLPERTPLMQTQSRGVLGTDSDAAIEACNQGQSLDTEAAGEDAEQPAVIEGPNEALRHKSNAHIAVQPVFISLIQFFILQLSMIRDST